MHGIRRSSRAARVYKTHHASSKGDGSENSLSIHARNTNRDVDMNGFKAIDRTIW